MTDPNTPFYIAVSAISAGTVVAVVNYVRELRSNDQDVTVSLKKYLYHRDKSKLLDRYMRNQIDSVTLETRYNKIREKYFRK